MLGSITTISTILAVLPGSRGKSGFNNPSSKAAARKTQPGSIFYPINYTEVLLKRNIFKEKVQSFTLNVPLFFRSARSNFTLRAVVPMALLSVACSDRITNSNNQRWWPNTFVLETHTYSWNIATSRSHATFPQVLTTVAVCHNSRKWNEKDFSWVSKLRL